MGGRGEEGRDSPLTLPPPLDSLFPSYQDRWATDLRLSVMQERGEGEGEGDSLDTDCLGRERGTVLWRREREGRRKEGETPLIYPDHLSPQQIDCREREGNGRRKGISHPRIIPFPLPLTVIGLSEWEMEGDRERDTDGLIRLTGKGRGGRGGGDAREEITGSTG